jgi:hypothetical protein
MTKTFLSNLWKWKSGVEEKSVEPDIKALHNFSEMRQSYYDTMMKFWKLMFNRILMGAFRYGREGNKKWDYIQYLKDKLELFDETGNIEYLVDVANLAWLEFEYGTHPKKHFKACDSENCKMKAKEIV